MTKNVPGATAEGSTTSTSSGGSSRQTVSINTPKPSVFQYLLKACQNAKDNDAEIPVRAENGQGVDELLEADLPEDWENVIAALDDDGIETVSFEDFFEADLEDVKYLGTEPLINVSDYDDVDGLVAEDVISEDDLEMYGDGDLYSHGNQDNGLKKYIPKPIVVEELTDENHNSSVMSDVNTRIAGEYWSEATQVFGNGTPARLKCRKGLPGNHDSELERMANVTISPESTDSTAGTIVRGLMIQQHISQDTRQDFEDGEIDFDDVTEIAAENQSEEEEE